MSERETREAEIESLLRRSMAAPVPSLPPNFDERVLRELREDSQKRERYRRILAAGYGLVSAVTCATIMRGQGLNWGAIGVAILVPLVLVAIVPLARRASHAGLPHGAK
ncbi:MAG TPA: hypothetical protein VKT53_02455 [Candidatus Acidoferrum sp.]|nr:hypothetical protein [Candidatus Acidoferrum sp.]